MKKIDFTKKEKIVAITIISVLIVLFAAKLFSLKAKIDDRKIRTALGDLRRAIGVYYNDHDGKYPSEDIVNELVQGKYIKKFPYVKCEGHKRTNAVITNDFDKNQDSGTWAYKPDNTPDSIGKKAGSIWLNCNHTDTNGNVWNQQ